MTISRRHFLRTCGLVAIGFTGLHKLSCASAAGITTSALAANGYGALVTDPDGLLDLPPGFKYQIISRYGQMMDDGLRVPHLPDGMATFPGPDGLTILIRNHELRPDNPGPFGNKMELLDKVDMSRLYDRGLGKTPGHGGTTTVVYDTKEQKIVRQFLSLGGTQRNCAGGPTPWNTWITCEETVQRMDTRSSNQYFYEKDHGYNFEVPASAEMKLTQAIPLTDMGRFNHEAVAVDIDSGIVYQTEDRNDGLIYRFIPNKPGQLSAGGKLQALKVKDQPSLDTRNWKSRPAVPVGVKLAVEWIDVEDVTSPKDDLREQGYDNGAARFARGEGMWRGSDGIYFACTSGGNKKLGQIWRYVPSKGEGTASENAAPGTLELFVEPNNSNLVENADNLTVAPWGDLIVCEDRQGDVVRLVGVTPNGKLYTFAHSHNKTEFAGVTFSPDGSTMFVNIQGKGWTVAITGPWQARVG